MRRSVDLTPGQRVALAACTALLLASAVLIFSAPQPGPTLVQFFLKPFSSRLAFGTMLQGAVPLMIAGIGVLLAFKSSNFNLGGEGQIYAGALAACVTGLALQDATAPLVAVLASIAAGMLTGALLASISGLLKAMRGVSEMISSFLLSAAVVLLADALLTGPLQDPASNFQTTRMLSRALLLPRLLPPSRLDLAFPVALVLIGATRYLARTSRKGFELAICGTNEAFARYCGIPVEAYMIGTMAVSGALHGLAGALLVLGPYGRVMRGFSAGTGWSAISVALLAQGSEAGILPAALFFAWLKAGSDQVMIGSGIPSEFIAILQAAAMFLVTASSLPIIHRNRKLPASSVETPQVPQEHDSSGQASSKPGVRP